jgi:septal ring factor EnvC (AmiA/AmiB activator)
MGQGRICCTIEKNMKTKSTHEQILKLHDQAVRREIERIDKEFAKQYYRQRLERAEKIARKHKTVSAQ